VISGKWVHRFIPWIPDTCPDTGAVLAVEPAVCAFPARGMLNLPSSTECVPGVPIASLVPATSPDVYLLLSPLPVLRTRAVGTVRTALSGTVANRDTRHHGP
jgi:hypothetical protein